MNIIKQSVITILLAFGLANVSLVNAEENENGSVPPMMNGATPYGMPMMGGQWGRGRPPTHNEQWNGMPMMYGQWGGMPMMGGYYGGMPMMNGQWGGPMMNGGWSGMPCYSGANVQQLEQRLKNIEEKLDKLMARQKTR
jgi:hypothetical protein